MIFPSMVAGIPCQIEVTHYSPAVPMRVTGTGMGDADPPEPAEFEFKVLDQQGKQAFWLERKLTNEDMARIEEEFLIMSKAEEIALAEGE